MRFAPWQWGYLYDLLHEVEAVADVTLANPYKTRIIAEAKIKTDKLDARWLAFLHRGGLIAESHASSAEARHLKELLRQRSFFVRQRTSLRNRVHVLLGTQRNLGKGVRERFPVFAPHPSCLRPRPRGPQTGLYRQPRT